MRRRMRPHMGDGKSNSEKFKGRNGGQEVRHGPHSKDEINRREYDRLDSILRVANRQQREKELFEFASGSESVDAGADAVKKIKNKRLLSKLRSSKHPEIRSAVDWKIQELEYLSDD